VLGDARITHIYTSEALRTRQTAEPTARKFGVEPVVVDAQDFAGLIRRVRETLRKDEATLVVGHRASVPRIVKELSGEEIPPLEVGEFDRLVVITVFPDGKSGVVTLRFGARPESSQSR
jgi:phosphohistidine phosphatase SixA